MSDPFDLSGKVALVTGGSRGLGLEICRAFARHGADVIVVSRKLENCETAARELIGLGRRAVRQDRCSCEQRRHVTRHSVVT